MDYKNNSNTGLIIVADCMLLSVEYIGNVHLFFNIINPPYSIPRVTSIDRLGLLSPTHGQRSQ